MSLVSPSHPSIGAVPIRRRSTTTVPDAITTLLTPNERARVDAAGEGCFVTLHRESVEEVLHDLRARRASAVLVSVTRYATVDAPPVARLVREFPRVPALALLTASEPSSSHAVLALGQQGVRALVDVRNPVGWRELRRLITAERSETIERLSVLRIAGDLAGAPEDCLRFFDALFSSPASVTTVCRLARRLGVLPSTLMSRFFRCRLPAPKQYLAMARLIRAARLFENPGFSVAQVANALEYSSPQSFSRHVHGLMHCTAVEFRQQFSGERMLETMRAELIMPHLHELQRFHPLAVMPGWLPR
jgi:AraC-like DNA-binding protein